MTATRAATVVPEAKPVNVVVAIGVAGALIQVFPSVLNSQRKTAELLCASACEHEREGSRDHGADRLSVRQREWRLRMSADGRCLEAAGDDDRVSVFGRGCVGDALHVPGELLEAGDEHPRFAVARGRRCLGSGDDGRLCRLEPGDVPEVSRHIGDWCGEQRWIRGYLCVDVPRSRNQVRDLLEAETSDNTNTMND